MQGIVVVKGNVWLLGKMVERNWELGVGQGQRGIMEGIDSCR